ncbi:hypothetical protein [Euzebya sp.]|uniref:hypothetical protein n=1 Tax=Euzebya sp. TaxID=1971409 RepID=UPI0035146B04
MSTATLEIYRTESGSVYEIAGRRIRRVAGDGSGAIEGWQEYVAINRVPASIFHPGATGEILEVVLRGGRRMYTSRLILPFG